MKNLSNTEALLIKSMYLLKDTGAYYPKGLLRDDRHISILT